MSLGTRSSFINARSRVLSRNKTLPFTARPAGNALAVFLCVHHQCPRLEPYWELGKHDVLLVHGTVSRDDEPLFRIDQDSRRLNETPLHWGDDVHGRANSFFVHGEPVNLGFLRNWRRRLGGHDHWHWRRVVDGHRTRRTAATEPGAGAYSYRRRSRVRSGRRLRIMITSISQGPSSPQRRPDAVSRRYILEVEILDHHCVVRHSEKNTVRRN